MKFRQAWAGNAAGAKKWLSEVGLRLDGIVAKRLDLPCCQDENGSKI
jgi:hypothetical protein